MTISASSFSITSEKMKKSQSERVETAGKGVVYIS